MCQHQTHTILVVKIQTGFSSYRHVQRHEEDVDAAEVGHIGSLNNVACDMDVDSNSSSGQPTNSAQPCNIGSKQSCGDEGANDNGKNDRGEEFYDADENGDLDDNSHDLSSEEEYDSFDDKSNDNETHEAFLGQIPNKRMSLNPEFNIAATLPLYEGSTLSMLCATLFIKTIASRHTAFLTHQ